MLVLDLLTSQPLDFRDLANLSATSATLRASVRQGPLHCITDILRPITHAHLARLLAWLREYGPAVRVLRLDQHPKSLWALPGLPGDCSDERDSAILEVMKDMPSPLSVTLEAIARSCPHLEELSMYGWVAYSGHCPRWLDTVCIELCRLRRLKKVHLPSAPTLRDTLSAASQCQSAVLDACLHLTHMSVGLNSASSRVLVHSPRISQLVQITLQQPAMDVLCLMGLCVNLSRLTIQDAGFEDDLDLFGYLPQSLRVLSLQRCTGALLERKEIPIIPLELQMFNIDAPSTLSKQLTITAQVFDMMCAGSSLLVLCVPGAEAFDDSALGSLVVSCRQLHTLDVSGTSITGAGFDELLDQTLLPNLQLVSYSNAMYESELDGFFDMSLQEIRQTEADELEDLLAEHEPALLAVRESQVVMLQAFFGFCKVVIAREWKVPLEANNAEFLPFDLHPLCLDYFRVGA